MRRSSGWARDLSRPRSPRAWRSRIASSHRAGPRRSASISGPSFAEEVARGLPTALTRRRDRNRALPRMSRSGCAATSLRAYVSDDLTGVEVGGAVKNVLAIAAGASDGLGFGDNARAALITRGLAETGRLVRSARRQARDPDGARRPRRPGADLHRRPVAQSPRRASRWPRAMRWRRSWRELGHVAEGVAAARAAHALAESLGVEMPICERGLSRALRRAWRRSARSRRCSRASRARNSIERRRSGHAHRVLRQHPGVRRRRR